MHCCHRDARLISTANEQTEKGVGIKRTLINVGYLLGAVVLSKFLSSTQSFFMAKNLNPQFFGIFLTFVIMISYGPILCLGAVETLLKEVPYLKGANQLQRVRIVESGVMGAIVLSAGVALLLGFIAPFVFPAELLGIPRNMIWAVSTTIAASLFSGYFYHRSA